MRAAHEHYVLRSYAVERGAGVYNIVTKRAGVAQVNSTRGDRYRGEKCG